MLRQGKMLLIPLVGEARYTKCLAIPTLAPYISDLMQDVAQARSIKRYDPGFHSVQFYDANVYWLSAWPDGYPLEEEWRLDHTVKGEKPRAQDVIEFFNRWMWEPEMTRDEFAPYVTISAWRADESRVLVTEGGVNWVAYGPCPACEECREQRPMTTEVTTECIAEEYLNYIPQVAGHIVYPQKQRHERDH